MARFTANQAEITHLVSIAKDLINVASQHGWKVRLVLQDGSSVEGRLTSQNGGNNGGHGGFWAYSGDVTVTDDNGDQHTVDLLDVDRVEAP